MKPQVSHGQRTSELRRKDVMTDRPGEPLSVDHTAKLSFGPLEVVVQSEAPHLAQDLLAVYSGASAPSSMNEGGHRGSTAVIYKVQKEIAASDCDCRLGYQLVHDGKILFQHYREEVLLPALEWVITDAARRSMTPYHLLHAGAVARNGHGILLPGPSGAGKSTTVAALALHGFEYCSDELAIVAPDAQLHPFPKVIALKAGGWQQVSSHFPEAVSKASWPNVSSNGACYVRPPSFPEAKQAQRGYPIDFILIPNYDASQATPLQPIPKSRALRELIAQSINLELWGAPGLALLLQLVQRAECYALATNDLPAAVALVKGLVRA